MRDLIRSCKLRLQRKTSVSDSDAESQPLVNSNSSTASFGTLHDDECLFANDSSDGTDNEAVAEKGARREASLALHRKRDANGGEAEICVNHSAVDMRYDRLPYFKPTSTAPSDHCPAVLQLIEDSLIVIPQKFMTLKDFKDVDDGDASVKQGANDDKDAPTQNSLVTIFAIWNTIMGSSLLAISWGLEKAGLIPGVFVILLISAICLYTAYVILQVNERYGIYRNNEVPDLCRLLLGRWAEFTAKIFSLIVLIGANIVYWILMSNFLYNSVTFVYDYVTGKEEEVSSQWAFGLLCPKNNTISTTEGKVSIVRPFDVYWNLYTTVPIFLSILMFPLLNFKSPTFFTKFNSLGTISVAYLFLMAIVKGATWGFHIPDWNTEWQVRSNFSALSGMLSLSFFIHNIIISICKNNIHQKNNGRDLSIAFGLVTVTYLTLGVVFYVCFPLAKSCLEDNILNNFPKYDTMAIIARMLLLFQLFTVFPLISYMLRINIYNNITAIWGTHKLSEFTYTRVIVLNIFVLIVCSLFACFLPRIGTMIRYTGAISGMVYIFTLPTILKLSALKRENALNVWNISFNVVIILIGACNLALQFFIQDG